MEMTLIIFLAIAILVMGVEYGVYRINKELEKMLKNQEIDIYEKEYMVTKDGEILEWNEDEQE